MSTRLPTWPTGTTSPRTLIMFQCLAVVAAICIHNSAVIEVVANASWSGARIAIRSTRITSVISSDVMIFPDRRRMNSYCHGSICIYYHMYCSMLPSGYTCRLTYTLPDMTFSRSAEIVSPTRAEMNDILNTLELVPYYTARPVKLSAFDRRSSNPNSPYCRPREDAACH